MEDDGVVEETRCERRKRLRRWREAAEAARERRDKARRCAARNVVVEGGVIVMRGQPGRGTNRVVMMEWERGYMETLVASLDLTADDDVLEIGLGLGLSAAAIGRREPRSHVVVEPAPRVLETAAKTVLLDVRCDTWQHFCATAEEASFSAVFFDDFPLAAEDDPDPDPFRSRWPGFLRAVSRILRPNARITGYLAHERALEAVPPCFRVEKIETYEAEVPAECPYHEKGLDACLVPRIRFSPAIY
ncbi:hypothetical protein CTAYLR_001178 [Chrysophaeum taylorii]|uniref:Uncharacterized protein n=1 Tax=Chrysophaeum taylorii TaxID=2483200 RepID=A0AAD7UQM7_9STRA|nr:hypothetical protein CTAYLR_001178 [Chrysophaeum taylorii]